MEMFDQMLSRVKSWWGVTFADREHEASEIGIQEDGVPVAGSPEETLLDPKANDPTPMGPDEAFAARNEILSKKLGVYRDMDGFYEMTEAALKAYGESGLTDAQIQGGYDAAADACHAEVADAPEEQRERLHAIVEDMEMYHRVNDPAWLASLPAAERTAQVEAYLAFEDSHTVTGADGKTQVYFGVTAEEYQAMGDVARAEYDAMVAACATSWGTSFHNSFDEYSAKPDVQDQADRERQADPAEPEKKAGFWATLTASAAGVAASVKSMMENSEVGKKIVAWFDGVKDRVSEFVGTKNREDLIKNDEAEPAEPEEASVLPEGDSAPTKDGEDMASKRDGIPVPGEPDSDPYDGLSM